MSTNLRIMIGWSHCFLSDVSVSGHPETEVGGVWELTDEVTEGKGSEPV